MARPDPETTGSPGESIDAAVFRVGDTAALETVLKSATGAAMTLSGAAAMAAAGPVSFDVIERLTRPGASSWTQLRGRVDLLVEAAGVRILRRHRHHDTEELAFLAFGTFEANLHHYPFEVTLDIDSEEHGTAWFYADDSPLHHHARRVASLICERAASARAPEQPPAPD